MQQVLSQREKTSLLKAGAILAVLINHYLNAHISHNYAGYANGIIALFFVLSGYGLSFSLVKSIDFSWATLKVFYIKRLLRIYPLYWLALLCAALFHHKIYSITTVLAFPLHKASGIYWFISSLLQCYLAAPFLYLLLHKKGLFRYLTVVFSCATLLQIFFWVFGLPFDPDYFVYRNFFLGHLLLFALGLSLPALLKIFPGQPWSNRILLIGAFLFFGAGVWATRPLSLVTKQDVLLIAPFFILICCLLVYATLRVRFRFPGKRLVIVIGEYSYSLYLFHLFYFALLQKIGLIQHGSLKSVFLTVLLFPVLVFFCVFIEDRAKSLTVMLQAKWQR